MPLHIFEPRYRLLIRRCIDRQRPFGIVLIRHGSEVDPSAEPYDVGTEAKIVAESALPDGRSYIVTRGERRFAVENLMPGVEPYLLGRVRYLDGTYLLAVVAVTDDSRGERALADDLRGAAPRDLAYRIAGSLAVDAPQQQALLELETASARLEEETRILNRETELLRDLLVRLRERGERPDLN
jgi:Lon protease-like protein